MTVKTLEGKIKGVTLSTIAVKASNDIIGPGHHSWVSGALPQMGLRITEEGKKEDTLVYFNAFANLKFGEQVRIAYKIEEDKNVAYDVEVLHEGKVVEKYTRNY
jgi:hypothetical protein